MHDRKWASPDPRGDYSCKVVSAEFQAQDCMEAQMGNSLILALNWLNSSLTLG